MVTLYKSSYYQGASHVYTNDTGSLKIDNDVSSLKISEGCCVTVYEQSNFKGRSRNFCKNTKWVGSDWNDKVSSFRLTRGDYPIVNSSLLDSEFTTIWDQP